MSSDLGRIEKLKPLFMQIVEMAAGDTLQLRSGSLGFGFYYITLCIELALPQ